MYVLTARCRAVQACLQTEHWQRLYCKLIPSATFKMSMTKAGMSVEARAEGPLRIRNPTLPLRSAPMLVAMPLTFTLHLHTSCMTGHNPAQSHSDTLMYMLHKGTADAVTEWNALVLLAWQECTMHPANNKSAGMSLRCRLLKNGKHDVAALTPL